MSRADRKARPRRKTPAASPRSGAETSTSVGRGRKNQLSGLSSQYRGRPAVPLAASVQTKVTVGRASDRFEREADNAADQVSAGRQAPAISRIPPGGLGAQSSSDGGEEVQTLTVQREPEEVVEQQVEDQGEEVSTRQGQTKDDNEQEGDSQPQHGGDSAEKGSAQEAATLQQREDKAAETQPEADKNAQTKCAGCEREEAAQRMGETESTQTVSESDEAGEDAAQMQDAEGETGSESGGEAETSAEGGEAAQTEPEGEAGEGPVESESAAEGEMAGTAVDEGAETETEEAEASGEELGCGEGGEGSAEEAGGEESGRGCGTPSEAPAEEPAAGGDEATESGAEESAEEQATEAPREDRGEGCESRSGTAAAGSESAGEPVEGEGVAQEQPEDVEEPPAQGAVQTQAEEDQGQTSSAQTKPNDENGQTKEEEAQTQEDEGESQTSSAQTKQEDESDQIKAEDGPTQTAAQDNKEQIQRQSAERPEEGDAQTRGAQCQDEEAQEQSADKGVDDKREEESTVQAKSLSVQAKQQRKSAIATQAIQNRGAGEPLSPHTRERLEGGLGVDLSHVRVHDDSRAREANKGLSAKAFTHKNHIWLGSGQSPTDLKLMAHETAHVVQQGSADTSRAPVAHRSGKDDREQRTDAVAQGDWSGGDEAQKDTDDRDSQTSSTGNVGHDIQTKPAASAASKPAREAAGEVAPGEIDLMGKEQLADVPESIEQWLAKRRKPRRTGYVNAKFGGIAKGQIQITRQGKNRFSIYKRQSMSLQHPLFQHLGSVSSDLQPRLFLYSPGRRLRGHVGLTTGDKYQGASQLYKFLSKNQELLGLSGLQVKLPRTLFELKNGNLQFGPVGLGVSFGEALNGSVTLNVVNDKITQFEGDANVSVMGLASGSLHMAGNEKGLVTGKVDLGVTLTKQFSGAVTVFYDGKLFSGSGSITYSGEKLSGKLTLNVMEQAQEQTMVEKKKAAGQGEQAAEAPKSNTEKKKKRGSDKFVVFGEGDLTFAFNDWLKGTANVVADRKGFVTIIGKIEPQKEITLFKRYDFGKKLPKIGPLEARASYGIPVVGNVYVGASVELVPFAYIGPGMLKGIEVGGTYSTDPAKNQDFSIAGIIYIPAAAGLSLTAKGKVGLVIIKHDISAGAGITADAGIGGYAEAKPVVGYREKNADGQDKKGEFFIKGDMTIAAQPFFGLKGFLFVELDSPWWSLAPDKTWRWPLFDKSWPLGEPLGINASLDYVLGSGEWPKVEVKKPKFDMDKFMSDMIHDRTQGKVSGKEQKKGSWKERNSKAAAPPKPTGAAPPTQPLVVAKGSSETGKKTGVPIAKGNRTADGTKISDLKRQAAKKGGKPHAVAEKPSQKPGAEESKLAGKGKQKDAHDQLLASGLAALKQVTARYAKDGATRKEVVTGVKSVRRKFKIFKSINVIDGGRTWDYKYVASEGVETGPPQAETLKPKVPGAAEVKVNDTIVHLKENLPLRVVQVNYVLPGGQKGVRAEYTDRKAFRMLPYDNFNKVWNKPKIPPFEKFVPFGGPGGGGKVRIDKQHIKSGTSAHISKRIGPSIGYDPKGHKWNQAGHLVAKSLAGPGGYSSGNIVPMTEKANTTVAGMKGIESAVLKDVKASSVYEYSAKPRYEKSKQIPPVSIAVEAERKFPSKDIPSYVPGKGKKEVDNTA